MGAKSGYIYIYIFLSGDVTRSNQFFTVNTVFKMATSFPGSLKAEQNAKFRALYDACSVANIPSGVPGTRVNPDTCARANSI